MLLLNESFPLVNVTTVFFVFASLLHFLFLNLLSEFLPSFLFSLFFVLSLSAIINQRITEDLNYRVAIEGHCLQLPFRYSSSSLHREH